MCGVSGAGCVVPGHAGGTPFACSSGPGADELPAVGLCGRDAGHAGRRLEYVSQRVCATTRGGCRTVTLEGGEADCRSTYPCATHYPRLRLCVVSGTPCLGWPARLA